MLVDGRIQDYIRDFPQAGAHPLFYAFLCFAVFTGNKCAKAIITLRKINVKVVSMKCLPVVVIILNTIIGLRRNANGIGKNKPQ